MIQREKRYVEVDVRFSTEGRLRPLQIIFDKGQVYKIRQESRTSAAVPPMWAALGPLYLYDSRQRARIMV